MSDSAVVGQADDENRYFASAHHAPGRAADHGVGQQALAVGAHNDQVVAAFFGLPQDGLHGLAGFDDDVLHVKSAAGQSALLSPAQVVVNSASKAS